MNELIETSPPCIKMHDLGRDTIEKIGDAARDLEVAGCRVELPNPYVPQEKAIEKPARRKRASYFDTCLRWWARTSAGKIVRGLSVERYDDFGMPERSYICILPNNDPRPKGVHLSGRSASFNDLVAGLPFGQWAEVVYPNR